MSSSGLQRIALSGPTRFRLTWLHWRLARASGQVRSTRRGASTWKGRSGHHFKFDSLLGMPSPDMSCARAAAFERL